MLEVLNFIRPELLISWVSGIILLFALLINACMNSKPKKNVYIPYRNSKGDTIGQVEFISYIIK